MHDALERILATSEEKIASIPQIELEPWTAEHTAAIKNAVATMLQGSKPTPELASKVESAVDVAHKNLNKLVLGFDPDRATIDAITMTFGSSLSVFLNHDRAHLADHLFMTRDAYDVLAHGLMRRSEADVLIRGAETMQSTTEKIREMYTHPWRMIRYFARSELGMPQEYEAVSIREHLLDTAQIMSQRFNAEVSTDPQHTSKSRKSIIITGDSSKIMADRGLIWSIAYNNLKNSQKKFENEELAALNDFMDEEEVLKYRTNLKEERVSRAHCEQITDNHVCLTFSDSGSGIDLNTMLSKIAQRMEKNDDLVWPNRRMARRFAHWKRNDYAFNLISMEDTTNLAFMANLTGAHIPSTLSSGMGLYGTRYIVEHLGGSIVYTTTFKGQHPVFSYIIPITPQKTNREAQRIRHEMIYKAA